MKPHRKIEITSAMLTGLSACHDGFRLASVLPTRVVSTNPEKNIKLALFLADCHDEHNALQHTLWLMRRSGSYSSHEALLPMLPVATNPSVLNKHARANFTTVYHYKDPMFYQQALAVIADRLLTARGR